MTPSPIISASDLQSLLNGTTDVRVLDCSVYLDAPQRGRQEFEREHIVGAVYADLDLDLSTHDPQLAINGGRHPLPQREVFAQTLGRWGITPDTQVIAYDRVGTLSAGRLWWMLRWCGHAKVQVLDGGWAAWTGLGGASASGQATAKGERPPYPLAAPLTRLVDLQTVSAALGQAGQVLVDARASARFRGEVEPLDPVAGHIPGALNRPFSDNFQADGRFKSADQLRREWLDLLGQDNAAAVIAYCGSGVSAIPNLIGLALAGLGQASLYAGSWSEWCRAGMPCARS